MNELSNKELLELYEILKKFIISLETAKEEINNDWSVKKRYWSY